MMQLISVLKLKPGFNIFKTKKWSIGIFIMLLTLIFILRYENHKVVRNHTVQESTKKLYFVTTEDFDCLFSNKNFFTEQESNSLRVWYRMRPFLERSDALPDTAQGIKEATMAFKDLISLINKEKVTSVRTSKEVRRNCPAFVTAFDGEFSGLSSYVLELPCGLSEDSSITVVGIPDEHSRSFQIELIGAKEKNHPIMLHYHVNYTDDDGMMEAPSIVQNTWTEQVGWGNEVRCPNHGSFKNQRVDEFPLCNEQTSRTDDDDDAMMDSSSLGLANFPFLKGNLFTATLWIGLQGFHMTVNGREETSFAYKEELKPWLVTAIKVSGGLKLLSTLATRLPVPEDHSSLAIEEKLKAPSLSGEKLTLLVGVFSTGNNFKRRMALRRTWMQYKAVRSGKVAVRFLIGLHTNAQVSLEIWREAQAYGDIQFMPFVDYYGLLSLKTVALCVLGTKVMPAKYIMKTDDDAFVRIDELLLSLNEKPFKGLLYGLISFDSSPDREQSSKWYINKEDWPQDSYPPWAHGPGYIISQDIAKFVVNGHKKKILKLFKLEDVAMGIWVQVYNQTMKRVEYINDQRFYNDGCESNYILVHYQTSRLILCLWEKSHKQNQTICCE